MSATIGIVRPKAEEEIKNVFERDYPNGDYDVIRAQVLSGWDDEIELFDIVAIVYATKSTGLSITSHTADLIFEHVDKAGSGFITAMGFQEALHDPSLKKLLKSLRQPALVSMLKNPTVRCKLCFSPPKINPYIQTAFRKIHKQASSRGIDHIDPEGGQGLPALSNEDGELQLNVRLRQYPKLKNQSIPTRRSVRSPNRDLCLRTG